MAPLPPCLLWGDIGSPRCRGGAGDRLPRGVSVTGCVYTAAGTCESQVRKTDVLAGLRRALQNNLAVWPWRHGQQFGLAARIHAQGVRRDCTQVLA